MANGDGITPDIHGKVSTIQFYEALLGVKKDMVDMERRIMDKLDCVPSPKEFELMIDHHKDISDRFEKHVDKDKKMDSILGVATIFGTILGVVFGTRK